MQKYHSEKNVSISHFFIGDVEDEYIGGTLDENLNPASVRRQDGTSDSTGCIAMDDNIRDKVKPSFRIFSMTVQTCHENKDIVEAIRLNF